MRAGRPWLRGRKGDPRSQSTDTLVLASAAPPADIISTVEFDHTGDYLATGDKGGRVVLFERNESVRASSYEDC